MANVFADLVVPAANGVGASSATDTMATAKTITVAGALAGASITIEGSHDNVGWFPIVTFTGAGRKQKSFATAYMRVRVAGLVGAFPALPNVDVAAERAPGSAFASLNVPAGNGSGAASDSSSMARLVTLAVAGAFTGTITFEFSEDGTDWQPIRSMSAGGAVLVMLSARWVRITRSGVGAVPGTPTVTVGAETVPADVSPDRTIVVSPDGGDFTTIEAAIVAANALVPPLSAAAPAVILVYPGVYQENPLTVPSYLGIEAVGNARATFITAVVPTSPIFTVEDDCTIDGFSISGANGVGGCGVHAATVGEATIRNMEICDCVEGFHATGAGVKLWVEHCDVCRVTGVLTNAVLAEAGAKIEMIAPHIDGSVGPGMITVGARADGAGSVIHVYNFDVDECVDAFYALNGGAIFLVGGLVDDCTYQYHIGAGGGEIVASGVTSEGITTYGLWIETAAGRFRGNGVMIRSDQMLIASGADVLATVLSDFTGDRANMVLGELAVGLPNYPAESVFGEGDSYVRTMAVLRNDNLEVGAWTDISTEMASASGSTADGFSGVAAGNCLYIGSSEKQFPGIKTLATVAQVTGAGNVDLEYWNGAAWIPIHYMAADGNSPWTSHGETIFERAQSDQVRWPDAADLTGWAQKALNGYTKWWVRFRITVGITSVPTLEQIKIHSNRTEINADGLIEFFGTARRKRALVWHKRMFLNFTGGGAPGNSNVTYAANITLNGINNVLADGAIDGLGGAFTVPEGLDTSLPLTVQWTWAPVSAPGNPSQVEFQGHFAQILEGDLVDGSKVDTPYNKIVVTTGAAQWQMFKTVYEADVSQLEAGEIVAFSFYRDATGGNPDDTLVGNVQILTFEIFGYFWR